MTDNANPASPALTPATFNAIHDDFIASLLPAWIRQASPAQINRLRDSFRTHQASQAQVREATVDLIPLQTFAEEHFDECLRARLPEGSSVANLEWLEVTPRFDMAPGRLWPIYGASYRRQQGLLRLMQNFHEGASFYEGSGLVAMGTFKVLSGNTDTLVSACRSQDVGQQYQTLLGQVFSPATCALLATDKRAGFKLAIEVAALRGGITAAVQIALRDFADNTQDMSQQTLRAEPHRLSLLGCTLADALVVVLQDPQGQQAGVVLYLPSDPQRALRYYDSLAAMNLALVEWVKISTSRQFFVQQVSLAERAQMLTTLNLRLNDAQPDLAPVAIAIVGDVFAEQVRHQVDRIKDDARLLLVPTALADQLAARQRLQAWKSAGLSLLGLAGLFIPAVGALLLGQLVVQTLAQVYEGAEDWYHGHQHEALQHMLGVAETVAVTAAVAAGASIVARGFSRSAFVDGLEPVSLENGEKRLWSSDLGEYSQPPEGAELQDDGLLGVGERRWIRAQGHFYEVHRPQADGEWRIRHPWRAQAFEPVVDFNGERGWRIRHDRPLEWDDSSRLLDCLWPGHLPIQAERAAQVLKVAGMDQDELRGVVVEGRTTPVNLRDTLRRFDADTRIEAFFTSFVSGGVPSEDGTIQAWCLAQPGIQGLDEQALRAELIERAPALRGPLLKHLMEGEAPEDALVALLLRDFPGLPPTYAAEAVRGVDEVGRNLALGESRIPLALASRARSLLQSARVSRALAGIYLDSAYGNETGELLMAVLGRLPNWPSAVNFELREGSESGRLIAVRDPQGEQASRVVLVNRDGRFKLYDKEGREREEEVAEPQGIFQAISAVLTDAQLARLGVSGDDPAALLRGLVQQHLPDTHAQTLRLLGWRAQPAWFNPARRMSDGRVGYPLSGRGAGAPVPGQILRDRVRALYPGFNDQELENFVTSLLNQPGSPFDLLLEHELSYRRLDRALTRWTDGQLQSASRNLYHEFSQHLRRAWQLQGESVVGDRGEPAGMRLDLSGMVVRSLPEIPVAVEFGHITVLVMCNLQLTEVPVSFLRAFDGVRRLTLNSNGLTQLPRGLGYMIELRMLRIAHNRVRMDEAGIGILAAMPHLRHLDLSYNPINRLDMRFNHLPYLRELRLRHCRLTNWPHGLELCGFLEYADLSNNQISNIPEAVLGMPLSHRMSYVVRGNPLAVSDLARLTALGDHPFQHPVEEVEEIEEVQLNPALVRASWVDRLEPSARVAAGERWDTLLAMPDSSGLFQLLGQLRTTSDFQQQHEVLLERVWSLLEALDGNAALREQVYARANEPMTCEDSVARRFSDLQVQVLVAQTTAQAAEHERGPQLLALGRQLFRLERVEQFAREDIAQRESEQRGVDEIEVSLYYRVHLAQQLELPLQPSTMFYEEVANVSAAQLQQALSTVRAAEASDAFTESLVQRDFWRRYLMERHEAAFDTINETFAERGSQLDLEQSTLTSEVYLQRWSDLASERESALHALYLRLTEDALAGDFTHP
ncbi:NEL-type E3 ubiquitin ligase domain-containing protein [Pseudomonas sp. NPDC089554]|uniref:NEL-type E3 ubiquitin ligase domain-containing protein n=1 Tax=Pseudomonas sp. NPDC089554 TaxID=3390653 RepID=UPI003D01ADB1